MSPPTQPAPWGAALVAATLVVAACGSEDDGVADTAWMGGGSTQDGDGDGAGDGEASAGTSDEAGSGNGGGSSESGSESTGGGQPAVPCGEGWGGDEIPGSVELGLASGPAVTGISGGQPDERTVFDAINAERQNAGLAPLTWSDQVSNVARSHAADMNQLGYFDHGSSTRPYNGNLDNWLPFPRLDFVYTAAFDRAGENIASGYPVSQVVPAWMDSSGHRAAILDMYGWTATHGGVGIDGSMYVFNPATCAN